MDAKTLKGITWGHSRGITPLLALSQRYSELHPGVLIKWDVRSLQEFADFPIEKLTEKYDLLVVDHPWVGCAAATQCVLPLDKHLPSEYLEDQAQNSVGQSNFSYQYEGHQWGLAIDAATPVASYRKDLFEQNNVDLPSSWEDVLQLANMGRVAVPAIPIDLLMNFYSFCIAHGNAPFQNEEEMIDETTGLQAIKTMSDFYSMVDSKMFQRNPIAVAELMTSSDDYWYCPFAYGYSNYSRAGYAKKLLHYGDVVSFDEKKLQTTIGGTGLAVSAFSNHIDVAVEFAAMAASGKCQRTMYVQHGGQPGHRSAWTDETANMMTNNFFSNTLPALERGYVRPRYNGYLYFQDHAGEPLQNCLINKIDAGQALKEMNAIYRQSFKILTTIIEA